MQKVTFKSYTVLRNGKYHYEAFTFILTFANNDNRFNIKKCSDSVTIGKCNLQHNRHNNLSITDVPNVTIRNCRFDNAKGTDPQFGIDIEPCKNVKIYDSTFTGNAKTGIEIYYSFVGG